MSVTPRARDFEKYWAVCGLPRADRFNQVITWNTALDEAVIQIARELPGLSVAQLRAAVAPLKGAS